MITGFYRDFYSRTNFPYLYLMNLGLNLPKAPYGPIFWFFISVTLVLMTSVYYWRYRYCLEEQVGISSHLTPKNLESTLLNFILVTIYGLSVVCYKNYWEKYVQIINQFGFFSLLILSLIINSRLPQNQLADFPVWLILYSCQIILPMTGLCLIALKIVLKNGKLLQRELL